MRINHNIAALNTYRQLTVNSAAGQRSLEKLSSGMRINKAGDDAAGLAISEKMRSQIRGLEQASRNSQDAISLIQTAEGGLNETHSILQRMRELAVQSSNDTNTTADRDSIQKEVDQLIAEIDRVGDTTEFNTKKLLNGSVNVGVSVASTLTTTIVANFAGTGDTELDATFGFSSVTIATQDVTVLSCGSISTLNVTFSASTEIVVNSTKFVFGTSDTAQTALDAINNAGIGVTATFTAGAITLTSTQYGSGASMSVTGEGGNFTGVADTQGVDAVVGGATASYQAVGNEITVTDGNAQGLTFDVESTAALGGTAWTVVVTSNGTMSMQIGANERQTMNIAISDMRANALDVTGLDVSTQAAAATAITTINDAIETVSSERSKLGAYQNRLEHTINNLGATAENITASESRVRDVDMAKEMMEFTKNNILSQAAQAMLAQANQQPQGVLQLLR